MKGDKLIKFCLSIVLVTLITGTAYSAPIVKTWESVREIPYNGKRISTDEELDIYVVDKSIIIVSEKPVDISVFTILGQLVGKGSLQSGSYRLNIGTRGIYIVKAGGRTVKVAL